ncbi:MAG: hypothetical protein Q4F41_03375 [Eubacteriales bacterium]|nr:hypothetical protein [Eubacteriales bacterium]
MKKLKKVFVNVICFCVLTAAMGITSFAGEVEEEQNLMVGAAVRDITPTEDMFPMPAVAGLEVAGVVDSLHTRIIAIGDGEETALIVSNETGKGPYGPTFTAALSEHTGIPVENIFYTATHAHAVPEIVEEIDLDFDEDDPEVTSLQKWGKLCMGQILEAADEALNSMQPATVGVGYSDCYVNVNRSAEYVHEDGTSYYAQGVNWERPSDKTLAVIRFCDLEGNPIAFIVNYAVHGIVMYYNQLIDGQMGVSADLPGFVSTQIETKYEGSVALWLSGAAGDQNPIVTTGYFAPTLESGDFMPGLLGNSEAVLDYMGRMQFADVLTAIRSIEEQNGTAAISSANGSTAIPGVEEEEFELHLSVLRIGDIALVGSPGELFNSIGIGLKENSLLQDTIIVNHVWTQEGQYNGYIPDDFGLETKGFNVPEIYQQGYVDDALVTLMNQLIEETD